MCSCHAVTGRVMVFDAEPHPDREWQIEQRGGRGPRAMYVQRAQLEDANARLFRPHHASYVDVAPFR